MNRLGAAAVLALVIAAAFAARAPAPLVSDFLYYHEVALGILRGSRLSSYFLSNVGPAYPHLLAVAYRLCGPSTACVKGLNVLLLLGLGFLAARLPSRDGVVPAPALLLLVTCAASLLPFVALLATEIPYCLLLAAGLAAASRGWERTELSRLLLAGATLGVSQAVRPVTLLFLTVLSAAAFVAALAPPRAEAPALRERLAAQLRRLAPVLVGFFSVACLLYASAGYGLRCQPSGNGLWSFYLGANPRTLGGWNVSDAQFVAHIADGPAGSANASAVLAGAVRDRWRAHARENLALWPVKLAILMALDANLNWAWPADGPPSRARQGLLVAWRTVACIVALSVFLACAWTALRGSRLDLDFPFLVAASVWVYLAAHALLLEINSRYGAPWWLVLYWLLPWALGSLRERASGAPAALDAERPAP